MLVQHIQCGQFVEMWNLHRHYRTVGVSSGRPYSHFLGGLNSACKKLLCCHIGFIVFWPIQPSGQLIRPLMTNWPMPSSSSRNTCNMAAIGGSTMIASFSSMWPSTLLFPGILSTRRPSSTTGSLYTLRTWSDHTPNQCTLLSLQQPTPPPQPSGVGPIRLRQSRLTRQPEPLRYICVSWNKGVCVYPGTCIHKDICTTCQLHHIVRDCPDVPSRCS